MRGERLTEYGIETGRVEVEKLWETASKYLKERLGHFSDETEVVQDGNMLILIECDKSSESGNARQISITTYDLGPKNKLTALNPESGIMVKWPNEGNNSVSLCDANITHEWIVRVKNALKKAK